MRTSHGKGENAPRGALRLLLIKRHSGAGQWDQTIYYHTHPSPFLANPTCRTGPTCGDASGICIASDRLAGPTDGDVVAPGGELPGPGVGLVRGGSDGCPGGVGLPAGGAGRPGGLPPAGGPECPGRGDRRAPGADGSAEGAPPSRPFPAVTPLLPLAAFRAESPCADCPSGSSSLPPTAPPCTRSRPPLSGAAPSGRASVRCVPFVADGAGLPGWSVTLIQPAEAATVITAAINRAGTGNWRTGRTSGGSGLTGNGPGGAALPNSPAPGRDTPGGGPYTRSPPPPPPVSRTPVRAAPRRTPVPPCAQPLVAQPYPSACSRSSSIPKWCATSCTTVISVSATAASREEHIRSVGPR